MANFSGNEVPVSLSGALFSALSGVEVPVGISDASFVSPLGVEVPVGIFEAESWGGDLAPTEYLQRLWDTGLSAYVYFTRESTDPTTPALAVGDTQPSNTGAFDFANHALLGEA